MNYFFGQQHIDTIDFFGENYHTIAMKDFPHYLFLKGDKNIYSEYLDNTWRFEPKNERQRLIKEKLYDYENLIKDIAIRGIREPIKCCNFRGKKFIIGGNHRAAIGVFLNLNIPRIDLSSINRIKQNIDIPGKFGLKGTKPYSSIYYENKSLIEGRRPDTLKRINMIALEDIRNKTILDIGCNIGSSSFLAIEKGAKKTIGIDCDRKILNAAIRNNVLFGYNSFFKMINLSNKTLSNCISDTAFIFSVDKHIKNDDNLRKIIVENVKNVVYFETHENGTIPQRIKGIFKRIDFIGKTGPNKKRKLFRCEL